ncbi:MAG: PAP2 superfamily [Algoriphagus marincola HL-49]|uniref:PAP2 superfamily n=1 Tax=Algoriphagus marincola HL-49 TaxID=1305737 RepID=A0A0P8C739_9BACT|nr:MAG: PAP2 superfamily [Algoriphagus marincola HL-49]
MKKKKNSISQIQLFAFFVVIILGLVTFYLPKGKPELFLNQYHHPLFDLFFATWTHLGDAVILLVLLPILALRKVSFAIFMSLSVIVQTLLIMITKHGFFKGMPRPAEYLKDIAFYKVPGIELHHWNSFPSGHTATGLVIASCFMIIFSRRRHLQWIFLLGGFLVAISRVYLMQHFFVDIFAGAALGMLSAWIGRALYFQFFPSKRFKRSLLVYMGFGKIKRVIPPIKNPGISV